MDEANVCGLARVLDQVARTRQVVVFTHDDRLAAAIRQLQIPATVWAVTRREHSIVTLTRNDDPVQQYIDDAFALAMTQRLDGDVKAVAVAGMYRFVLEAACVEVVRSRQRSSWRRTGCCPRRSPRTGTPTTLRPMPAMSGWRATGRGPARC
jgi:hypothetical protein